MNRTTMSPVSAIQLVAAWIETHGRRPLRDECRKENGLPHYITLVYVCGGVVKAGEVAQAYLTYGSAALSGLVCDGQATGASACPCSTRMTTCLRCGRAIVWEGPHVRQCDACRKGHRADAGGEPVAVVHGVAHAYLTARAWREVEALIDWSET